MTPEEVSNLKIGNKFKFDIKDYYIYEITKLNYYPNEVDTEDTWKWVIDMVLLNNESPPKSTDYSIYDDDKGIIKDMVLIIPPPPSPMLNREIYRSDLV